MKVDSARREALRAALERAGAQRREAKGSGEVWRYALDGGQVTLWRTGTVLVQGKGEGVAVLERLVAEFAGPGETGPRAAGTAAEPGSAVRRAAAPPELRRDVPWAGVDESGKGDYFGPLVSAAVLVEPGVADELTALGVQDSKRLTDPRVRTLAPEIRARTRHALTSIAPPRYNELYAEYRREGRRLNQLLAWAHVSSLMALLEGGPAPDYAIVDQFADARILERAAETRTQDLRIVQFPRAESDVAVAAASILAREAFLDWLAAASERVGVPLPKGASEQVVDAAREVVAIGGQDLLATVAKLHFATTERVLG